MCRLVDSRCLMVYAMPVRAKQMDDFSVRIAICKSVTWWNGIYSGGGGGVGSKDARLPRAPFSFIFPSSSQQWLAHNWGWRACLKKIQKSIYRYIYLSIYLGVCTFVMYTPVKPWDSEHKLPAQYLSNKSTLFTSVSVTIVDKFIFKANISSSYPFIFHSSRKVVWLLFVSS